MEAFGLKAVARASVEKEELFLVGADFLAEVGDVMLILRFFNDDGVHLSYEK